MPLNALRSFEAAARLGSFQAAAEELSVTPSAVSLQVRRLEEILDYIRDLYPDATLAVRERRERRALQLAPAAPRAATGALNRYAED